MRPQATNVTLSSIVQRRRTKPGVPVYDQFEWEKRRIVQESFKDGSIIFERDGIEVPAFWSDNAATILTTKYLRKVGGEYESSLRQAVDRIVDTITAAGVEGGYFDGEQAEAFNQELKFLMVDQRASFNTPVWFNIGVPGVPQQASACFILNVDDNMSSIQRWFQDEITIFLGGSGAGINVSNIRSSRELLSSGNRATGPLGFMRSADAAAGVVKSGNAARKAAKMVVLDDDHPDVREYILCKVREGRKAAVLASAGYDMDLDGEDIISIQYQNANNSVRVSDNFMKAALEGGEWALISRTTGEVTEVVQASELLDLIAEAAWECADPGLHYRDTINHWHTLADTSEIRSSNPCSEYMSLDNSACNLASINLLRYLGTDGIFDLDALERDSQLLSLAMEILVGYSEYPTPQITTNARRYRQLGMGVCNLGALLMCMGMPYDSDQGRAMAAALQAVQTGAGYLMSATVAGVVGPFAGYEDNSQSMRRVLRQHRDAAMTLAATTANDQSAEQVAERGLQLWEQVVELAEVNGVRNSQMSVAAPTGTTSFVMGADTTGIEPDFALIKYKKMVGGGSMTIVNQSVTRALAALGYDPEQSVEIISHITDTGHVVGAPGLDPAHYAVFSCAVGENPIEPLGHVRMVAALQPFLSGAASKTVNLPASATVDEIKDIYVEAWRMGCKAISIYRDGSKSGQPLSSGSGAAKTAVDEAIPEVTPVPVRRRLPRTRPAKTTSFRVHDLEGYMTTGEYEDGSLGEVFIKVSKMGSTLSGLMDALSVAVSVGLQYGVPLETFVAKYAHLKFEPAGMTDDADLRIASSVVDYVFRRLALTYLEPMQRQTLGIWSNTERAQMVAGESASQTPKSVPTTPASSSSTVQVAMFCNNCGQQMKPSGACFACDNCGATSGCS